MLLNLLLNAVEAMPKGGVISIKARLPRTNAKHFTVEVRDSGTGIKKADLLKVCRHDFSTKGKRHGFGLFIVERIIADYKGKMALRSERRKGTVVTLDLPSI
jgi:signal transduction histidine kinase